MAELDEQIELIHSLLTGPESIPVDLRTRKGLNSEKWTTLHAALEAVERAVRHQPSVPKKLAHSFVDIASSFDLSKDYYGAEESERIEDVAEQIVDLAYRITEAHEDEDEDENRREEP